MSGYVGTLQMVASRAEYEPELLSKVAGIWMSLDHHQRTEVLEEARAQLGRLAEARLAKRVKQAQPSGMAGLAAGPHDARRGIVVPFAKPARAR